MYSAGIEEPYENNLPIPFAGFSGNQRSPWASYLLAVPERLRPCVWTLIALLVWQTMVWAEVAPGAALPEALPQVFPTDFFQDSVGQLRGREWAEPYENNLPISFAGLSESQRSQWENYLLTVPAAGPGLPDGAPFRSAARRRPDREQKKHLGARLFLGAGTALACGAAAWWSREKADRAYEKYMRSASLRRQERQFDRAERYDRIAGTAFVGMEAGLALTTYLLFF